MLTSRNLISVAGSALKANPRAPGLTVMWAAAGLWVINPDRGLLIEKSSGPGGGRCAALDGKISTGPALGDRNAFRRSVVPSLVATEEMRRAHSARSAP